MELSRRTYLAGVSGAMIAIAGCMGDGADEEVEEPSEPPLPIPTLGDPDAEVTVRVFEDFSCPHCGDFKQDIFPQIQANYIDSGDIRYEHHDFPIPVDDTWSWAIAGGARSVQDQEGDEAFWAFAGEIYEYLGSYSYDAIETVADNAGADGEQARADAEDGVYREDLQTLRDQAESAGIEGTPTVVVGEQVVDSSFEAIEAAIDGALE